MQERNALDTCNQVILSHVLQPPVENCVNQAPRMNQVEDTYRKEGPWEGPWEGPCMSESNPSGVSYSWLPPKP